MSRIEFERLFGGRVLAWIGGLATLLGVVFLMRSAVDSSWFTEEVRALLAAVGSLLLLGVGVWLHERKGQVGARAGYWSPSRFRASTRRRWSPPRPTS